MRTSACTGGRAGRLFPASYRRNGSTPYLGCDQVHIARDRHMLASFRICRPRRWEPERLLMIRRRDFITLLGSTAVAWPLGARAQQPGRVPTIGYLGATTRAVESQQLAAFERRLRELGWTDGRNVAIEYRWVEGRNERPATIATELVRLKVDVIVTWGTANIVAAKEATTVIPIVFPAAADPVGMGLVTSLARPGGNATGLSILALDLAGKRLELLREVVPQLRHLAVMAHVGAPGAMLEMAEVQATARALNLDVTALELQGADNIPPAFETLKGRADALFVCVDPLTNTHRVTITKLAIGARLPTMYGQQ